jgi:FkbM family methyltransferase
MNGRAFAKSLDFGRRWRWTLIRLMDVLGYKLGKYKSLNATNRFFQVLQEHHIECVSEDEVYNLRYSGQQYVVRKNSTDSLVFQDVIINEEYGFLGQICRLFSFQPQSIVDAGANCGFTSLYLSAHFPLATIVSLEPDPENFNALGKNIACKPSATILASQVGLAHKEGWLVPETKKTVGSWASSFLFSSVFQENAVPAVTVEGIRKAKSWDSIDLLKIDIEGAEWLLFTEGDSGFLARVKMFVVEVHDEKWVQPISAIAEKFEFLMIQQKMLLFGVSRHLLISR